MIHLFIRKRTILFAACFFIAAFYKAEAQTESYSLHTIKAGETLSAIAKANQTTVGNIMRINGMNSKSVLKLNSIIKVPIAGKASPTTVASLLDSNLGIPTKPTVLQPTIAPTMAKPTVVNSPIATAANNVVATTKTINYTVVKGDNLYKISKQFNVTQTQLMQWNGMKNDKVGIGQMLTIAQTTTSPAAAPIQQPTPQVVNDAEKVFEPTAQPAPVPVKAVMPAMNNAKKETVTSIKTVVAPPPAAVTKTSADVAPTPTVIVVHDTVYIMKKDTVAVEKPTVLMKGVLDTATSVFTKDTVAQAELTAIPKNAKYVNEEGYFAAYFNRKENISSNTTTGDAATFKSASGWNDKKFFVLINNVPQGTIVRITLNKKAVCAKVMGPLPTIKEDAGLIARVNDAAAAALGTEESKFPVTINY
jgi:LysM repeat protein